MVSKCLVKTKGLILNSFLFFINISILLYDIALADREGQFCNKNKILVTYSLKFSLISFNSSLLHYVFTCGRHPTKSSFNLLDGVK